MPTSSRTNLNELTKIIRKRIDKVRESNNEIAKSVARQIMIDVTQNTIVDTSQALSNWVATLDRPHQGRLDAFAKGKDGSTEAQSQSATLAIANSIIENKQVGQPLFISNDLQDTQHEFNAQVDLAKAVAVENAQIAVIKAKVLIKD